MRCFCAFMGRARWWKHQPCCQWPKAHLRLALSALADTAHAELCPEGKESLWNAFWQSAKSVL